MAKYTITYRGLFAGVSLPACDPGVTLMRGESAEVGKETVEALVTALDNDALPGLSKDDFQVEEVDDADAATDGEIDVSKVAAELAEQEDVDLAGIEGSGANGKITKPDVEQAIAERAEE